MVVATKNEAEELARRLRALVPAHLTIKFNVEEDLELAGSYCIDVVADPGDRFDFADAALGKWEADAWFNPDCRSELCVIHKVIA